MISASEYISLAALLMLEANSGGYPKDRKSLAQNFELTYSYQCKDEWTDIIVKQLQRWNAISVHNDRFAGETFRMFHGNLANAVSRLQETELGETISSAKYEGASWFKRVFESQEYWPSLYKERNNAPLGLDYYKIESKDPLIPASDRIVLKSDNQSEIDEIKVELANLKSLIGESRDNEVGSELGDDREIICNELEVADQVIDKPRFRLASLMGWLLPALRFLAKRFAGKGIDEVAMRLLALLEKL